MGFHHPFYEIRSLCSGMTLGSPKTLRRRIENEENNRRDKKEGSKRIRGGLAPQHSSNRRFFTAVGTQQWVPTLFTIYTPILSIPLPHSKPKRLTKRTTTNRVSLFLLPFLLTSSPSFVLTSLAYFSSHTKLDMCNPKPSSPSSFLSPMKAHFMSLNKTMDLHTDDEEEQQLHRWPTPSEVKKKKEKMERGGQKKRERE